MGSKQKSCRIQIFILNLNPTINLGSLNVCSFDKPFRDIMPFKQKYQTYRKAYGR